MADRGLFGLRRIANHYVADGTGRDWCYVGDRGFRDGRVTPGPNHQYTFPKNKNKPTPHRTPYSYQCHPSGGPNAREAVLNRWMRADAAVCSAPPPFTPAQVACPGFRNENDIRLKHSASEPHLPGYPSRNLTSVKHRTETLQERPQKLLAGPAPELLAPVMNKSYTDHTAQMYKKQAACDKPLVAPHNISKYHYFSNTSIHLSPSFEAPHPMASLREAKRSWRTDVRAKSVPIAMQRGDYMMNATF